MQTLYRSNTILWYLSVYTGLRQNDRMRTGDGSMGSGIHPYRLRQAKVIRDFVARWSAGLVIFRPYP